MGNVLAGSRRARQNSFRRLDPDRVLEVLELTDLARSPVQSLSGGELRRVALARALCSGPEILLLDEPLSGLDTPLRRRILGYLLRVRRAFALPALVVSHDATEIRILSREVLLLDQGRVAGRGDPDALFVERYDAGVAGEEGFENVLRGRVRSVDGADAIVELEAGGAMMVPAEEVASGTEVTIGIRSEELILAVRPVEGLSAQNILPARVRELAEPGSGDGPVRVVAEIGASHPAVVVALVTRRAVRDLGLRPGLPIQLICKARACRILASLPG
jgi:molybdate transport system ATP-binding protein